MFVALLYLKDYKNILIYCLLCCFVFIKLLEQSNNSMLTMHQSLHYALNK